MQKIAHRLLFALLSFMIACAVCVGAQSNQASTQTLVAQYSGEANWNAATGQASVAVTGPFSLSTSASSLTINNGQTATYDLTLTANNGFSGQVLFTCVGAPGGSTCTVTPNPATLSSTSTSVALMVAVSNTSNARLAPGSHRPFGSLPFVFAGIIGAGMFGLRRKPRQLTLLLLGVFLTAGIMSCGGSATTGGGIQTPPPPTNAVLTVTGTSGSSSTSITLNLTITHLPTVN